MTAMASRWVRITDQQEAIRLAKAGLLYWKRGGRYTDTVHGYNQYHTEATLVTHEWESQLHNWFPSVLVEDDEE